MRHRRQFQVTLDATGTGKVEINPNNTAMEWQIHQVSVNTKTFSPAMAALYHNSAYLHSTPIGSLDSATGPPYPIVGAGDIFTIEWTGGIAHDQATATIWYEENPARTTGV